VDLAPANAAFDDASLADANGLDDIFIAVPYAPALIPARGSRNIDRRGHIIGRIVVITRLGDGAAHDSACRQAAKQADREVAAASSRRRRHEARADCERGKTGSKALPIRRMDRASHGCILVFLKSQF
jgi:hypothetical protein